MLAAGANVNAEDKEGQTVLHWAVVCQNPSVSDNLPL
jgi:ankyrin repeat protein